jgi:hypothetical protein
MSSVKYIIINGNTIIGMLWENELLGKVFTTTGANIDLNNDLEIYDCDANLIKNIDLRDAILSIFPHDIIDRVEE